MPQAEQTIPTTFNDCMDVVRASQGHYPVQTIPIAQALGLRVFKVPEWPAALISGQLLKLAENGGTSGYAIYVNADHPQSRRRFTIAHKIAHFILHRDQIGGGIEDDGIYRSRLGEEAERQASLFAVDEILVPNRLFERAFADLVAKNERVSIPVLAEMFDVPNSVMSIKMGVPHETVAPDDRV